MEAEIVIDTAGLITSMIQFSKQNRWNPGEVARDSASFLMPFLQKVQGTVGTLILPPEMVLASALEAEFQGDKSHTEAARAFSEAFCIWFGGAKSMVGDKLLNIQPNQGVLETGLLNLQSTGEAGSFAQSFGALWGDFIRASKDGAGVPLH